MLILMMVGHRDMIGTVAKKCDEYIPNNITIVPNYRVTDSLSDQVSSVITVGGNGMSFGLAMRT